MPKDRETQIVTEMSDRSDRHHDAAAYFGVDAEWLHSVRDSLDTGHIIMNETDSGTAGDAGHSTESAASDDSAGAIDHDGADAKAVSSPDRSSGNADGSAAEGGAAILKSIANPGITADGGASATVGHNQAALLDVRQQAEALQLETAAAPPAAANAHTPSENASPESDATRFHAEDTYDPTFAVPDHPEEFVVSGGRWTNGGGFTTNLGGTGGTVNWSIAGAGLTNQTSQNFFTGSTVDMGSFLSFDFVSLLQQAFDEWSSFGNINFVQVADSGGNIGVGDAPTIRIVGGFIDGENGPNVLARAFFPSTTPAGGDIVFDSGNTSFYSNSNNFYLTALHEIGHAIGLRHEETELAIMNPSINTNLNGLQQDDINGIRAVYGASGPPAPDLIANNVTVSDTTPTAGQTVTVTYDISNLGNSNAANTTAGIYISTDNVITVTDTRLATQLSTDSNAPGAVDSETQAITIPAALAPGTYWVGVIADYNNQQTNESSETNNASTPVQITIPGADDYGETPASAGSVSVGGSVTGNIEIASDRDWFAVTFQTGQSYQIDLEGSPTSAGTLSDPYLRGIYDASGTLIPGTLNDDGGVGLNSQLSYTATTGGTHYVSAGAFSTRVGTYTLSVTPDGATSPVTLLDAAGAIVNTFNTIQAAENAASDNFTIEVGASYAANPEAVQTDLNGLTFNLPAGVTPTITMQEAGNTLISLTGTGNASVIGNSLANIINGNAGDNVLNGKAGADTMRGGLGNDTLFVDNAGDIVEEAAGGGSNDRVATNTSYALTAGAEIELFTTTALGGTAALNLTGNALAQTIVGNAGANVLSDGGLGGNDTLRGLGGNDIYIVNNTGAIIEETAGQGTNDRVAASLDFSLAADDAIELLTTTSTGSTKAINLTGNALMQTIIGNAGANTLHTGGGATDIMRGLGGNDTYRVFNSGDMIEESVGQGSNDRVTAAVDYALGADVDIELMTTNGSVGTAGIDLTGNALAQTIIGNAGDNRLSDGGGAAADVLSGLGGNDTYIVRNSGTTINETAGRGANDRVAAGVDFVLAANDDIELLTTTSSGGTAGIDLTGNALAQTIIGNAGANTLHTGGGAADTMRGLGGNDTYRVFNSGDTIIEAVGQGSDDWVAAAVDYVLGAGVEIERISTNGSVGTSGIDLTGNEFAQTITGNAGNNLLNTGGGAADTMRGLGGNDIYRVFNAGDTIIETAGNGTDRVISSVDYTLGAGVSVELMTTNSSAGTADIDLTGNKLAQTIVGTAGINRLSDGGGAGADTLRGLNGNDTYIVRNAGTTIEETAGQGANDRVAAGVDFVLAADDDIEQLTTTSSGGTAGIDLTGNDLAQTIIGNAGANRIDGQGGNDNLRGLAGNDTFVFASALGANNVDTIVDYVVADDQIALDTAVFDTLGAPGGILAASAFRANATGLAQDASDRIIYETDTGRLLFDADGLGGVAGQHFATLSANLAITNAEFDLFLTVA